MLHFQMNVYLAQTSSLCCAVHSMDKNVTKGANIISLAFVMQGNGNYLMKRQNDSSRIENFQVFFKLLIILFCDNRWALDPPETHNDTYSLTHSLSLVLCALATAHFFGLKLFYFLSFSQSLATSFICSLSLSHIHERCMTTTATLTNQEQVIQ